MMSDVAKRAIILVIVAVVVAGVGYLAWQNHDDFGKIMVEQAQAQLLITAKSEAQSIESYIANIHTELEILASEFVICRIIRKKYNKTTNPEYCAAMENSYKDVEKLVDAIYLIDSQGVVINASPFNEGIVGKDFSAMPGVKGVLKSHRPYTGPVFKSFSKGLALALIHPVFENGEFIGMLRAVMPLERINSLIGHINQDKIYALLLDGNNIILSYPDAGYIGLDVNGISGESVFNRSEFRNVLKKVNSGEQGAEGLFAFVPIRFGSNAWSIIVAADYGLIAGPVNKNAKDNLITVGFVFLVFVFAGIMLYRIQKKRAQLSISARALDIINKQLHLEIDERKRLEEELQKCAGQKRLRRQ